MSEPTKTCNLTKDEVGVLICHYGYSLHEDDRENKIERINYLNKRLKAFNEVEVVFEKENKSSW